MTPKERAAMQQALEALIVAEEFVDRHSEDWYISGQQDLKQIRESITALREALAEQAEQEPVACIECGRPTMSAESKCNDCHSMDDAAPVRTKDLTDDEIESVVTNLGFAQLSPIEVARAVIAADRSKNK